MINKSGQSCCRPATARDKIIGVERLITDYEIKLVEPGCAPGASQWNALITIPNDISGVFPYLNALSDRIWYDHDNETLIWREDTQTYAFRPREIRAALVKDPLHARDVAWEIIGRVNEVWEKREHITPRYTERKPPPVIEILRLLPQTNCRHCGYPTCMAFAADLSRSKVTVEDCPLLCLRENSERKEQITSLFINA